MARAAWYVLVDEDIPFLADPRPRVSETAQRPGVSTDVDESGGTTPETPVDISLFLGESGELWVARDEDSGVASQGETREAALDNLDEAVALYHRDVPDGFDAPEEERTLLRELGIDPDEVEKASEESELPEFMQ